MSVIRHDLRILSNDAVDDSLPAVNHRPVKDDTVLDLSTEDSHMASYRGLRPHVCSAANLRMLA